jgi:hypothetical protein
LVHFFDSHRECVYTANLFPDQIRLYVEKRRCYLTGDKEMRYWLISLALTSLTLTAVQAGEGVNEAKEPAKDKAPRQALRLTLEAPGGPVVIDKALTGRIPIRVWAENLSDKPIVVCRPVDGCTVAERDPRYIYRLVDGKGREVPRSEDNSCPWLNSLDERDFITLQPKEKTDLLKTAGVFGELTAHLFKDLQPGEYRLTLTYVMMGTGKAGLMPALKPGPKVAALLQKSLQGEATSNAVKVRFIAAPATEELLKIIESKEKKVLSPADAVLVLGHRRDPRGYRPTLAALSNKDWEIRRAAAFSLREYAAAYSVGQLKDKDIEGKIPPELLESLRKAADDSDGRVREIAAISLRFAKQYRDAAKHKK